MTVWDVQDVLDTQARHDREQLLWLMAASPWENPGMVISRRQEIEKGEREAAGREAWLADAARRKAEKEDARWPMN